MPDDRRSWDPGTVRQWQRIGRDAATTVLGVFLCTFAAVAVHDPTVLTILLGAGLTALGLAPALRLDERVRRNGNGNGNGHSD